MQSVVHKRPDFLAFLRPEGEIAVKELCESLEDTRGLLAERAGQAQLETTGLEPLPQDRMSLAFVQAVFKHNLSPSNIEDAIIALKDFQFEVESSQQTTELAFQQVWRVYDIVKSRTLQRRSSISTISSISTQIPESFTSPQATTSFRKEIIEWLKRQDVASKASSGTPRSATQIGRGGPAGTSAEENNLTPESQSFPIRGDQELSSNRIRNIFGFSRARQDYMTIEPFQLWPSPPPQLSPEQPVYSDRDTLPQQPIISTTIYDQGSPQLPRRHSQTIHPRTATYDVWLKHVDFSARLETESVTMSPLQALPPIPESRTPLVPFLLPSTAHGVGSLDSYTSKQGPAGTQPPSSNKLSPAVTETPGPSMNGNVRLPRTYGHVKCNSVKYGNGLSGVESPDDGDGGSIHSQDYGEGWVSSIFGRSKEREREKEALKELRRMIGACGSADADKNAHLGIGTRAVTATGDWDLALELCERTSASENAAKEAAKALKQEFKCVCLNIEW